MQGAAGLGLSPVNDSHGRETCQTWGDRNLPDSLGHIMAKLGDMKTTAHILNKATVYKRLYPPVDRLTQFFDSLFPRQGLYHLRGETIHLQHQLANRHAVFAIQIRDLPEEAPLLLGYM